MGVFSFGGAGRGWGEGVLSEERQTDRQRQTDRPTESESKWFIERETDRQTNTDRQRSRQTGRQNLSLNGLLKKAMASERERERE